MLFVRFLPVIIVLFTVSVMHGMQRSPSNSVNFYSVRDEYQRMFAASRNEEPLRHQETLLLSRREPSPFAFLNNNAFLCSSIFDDLDDIAFINNEATPVFSSDEERQAYEQLAQAMHVQQQQVNKEVMIVRQQDCDNALQQDGVRRGLRLQGCEYKDAVLSCSSACVNHIYFCENEAIQAMHIRSNTLIALHISCCPNLITVDLDTCNLKILILESCPIFPVAELLKILRSCPVLEQINVSRNRWITTEVFSSILHNQPRLKKINLTGCYGISLEDALAIKAAYNHDVVIERQVIADDAAIDEFIDF